MAARNALETTIRKKTKSSLVSHTLPPFYACYLLRSMKSPKSRTTYIGSTPHPPRRIRQHNGELTQGAWKTSRGRPWVMSMLVHGFPSKLAALQFEWAWQHPHLSRHLRGKEIAKGKSLKDNIAIRILRGSCRVAHVMLVSPPYSSWPLHVKLFTAEAVKHWDFIRSSQSIHLPLGFTYTIELEGVDGKSGKAGSGRKGPIDVTDARFTSEHLAKHNRILFNNELQRCVVCQSSIDIRHAEALSTALCPNTNCTAYAHLTCLSNSFLATTNEVATIFIPRGGTCAACKGYILWGDVIRGCYRRSANVAPSASALESETEDLDNGANLEGVGFVTSSPVKKKTTKPSKGHRKKPTPTGAPSDEGEYFDIDNISSCSASSSSELAKRPVNAVKGVVSLNVGRHSPPQGLFSHKPMEAFTPSKETVYDVDEFCTSESDDCHEIATSHDDSLLENFNALRISIDPPRNSKPAQPKNPSIIEISD